MLRIPLLYVSLCFFFSGLLLAAFCPAEGRYTFLRTKYSVGQCTTNFLYFTVPALITKYMIDRLSFLSLPAAETFSWWWWEKVD